MSNFTATFHVDGSVDCKSLQLGILMIGGDKSPVVKGEVITESQRHPFWALDRLAVVIHCYVLAAKQLYENPEPLQVNLAGVLVSGGTSTILVARSMTWHTSAGICNLAEKMITDLADSGDITLRWPGKNKMDIATIPPAAMEATRTFPRSRSNSRH